MQAQLDTIKPRALVVDSIQTVFLPDLESAPGSVAQVRECGARLMTLAKGRGIATFLVGHVTKDGALAGPRVLEHLVDTVLYFEGEQHHAYRVLRAVKNRFGSTNEIGVFEMAEPAAWSRSRTRPASSWPSVQPTPPARSSSPPSRARGRCCSSCRPSSPAPRFGTPRRTVLGADYNRVCLLLAVLEKRVGLPIGNPGRVRERGRAADAWPSPPPTSASSLAAASSYLERPVPGDVVVIGEVGLTGEVRAVSGLEARLRGGRGSSASTSADRAPAVICRRCAAAGGPGRRLGERGA